MRHLRSLRHKLLIAEVRAAREAAGLSQRQVSARLRRAESYWAKIESAERRLEACELLDFCEIVGADATEIVRRLTVKR